MKLKFSNTLLLATAWLQFFVGCAYQTTYTYRTETKVEKPPSGIYVEAMSFANDIQNITGGNPVFLNEEGGPFLVRAIVNRYKIGYAQNITPSNAVEQAISAINSHREYFPDVESVDIVVISDKEPSAKPSTQTKAIGKDVNVHYFNADKELEEIPAIATKFTEAFNKSSVVYLVLDAAPKDEHNAVKIQYSAVAVLDALSEKVDMTASTPLVKVFVDEKKPKSTAKIDWFDTSMYWLNTVLVVVVTGAIVALIVVIAKNSDSSSNETN